MLMDTRIPTMFHEWAELLRGAGWAEPDPDEEIARLNARIDRLRFAVRWLEDGYAGEYGHDGASDAKIESHPCLELQPGDMTGDVD